MDVPDYTLTDPVVETVFVSPTLKCIPKNPLAVFVLVKVPPGGETSVHTHPGPEFIYQLSGGIDCQGYQNDIFGMLQITNGDIEGIPPTTSVQNRNPSGGTVAFLSWFLVDLSQPFASPAFSHDTGLGINLASLRNGVSVAAVSSNFGEGGIYSTFGAADAIDWDPPTEWSSASDGDTAPIGVELASETNITSVGFWTQTMGDTA